MARAILVLMGLGLAACALVGPALTPVQEAELRQVRALVDDAARAYRLGSVPVVVGPVAGAVAAYRQGTILVDPALLGSPHRDAVIAHELGHAVLGHGH
jgi:Zn-dependent protease with chaperone function